MDSRYSGWRTVAGSIVVLGAVSGWASANPTMYHTWHADLPNVIAEEEGKVEEDPNNVGKVPFLAEVYIEAERFEDAERELDRVSVLPGVEPGAVKRLRGEIMLASGDTEGGRAMIWAAAEECTRARDARRIWRRVGDIEEYYLNPYSAAEAYERAAGIALGVSEGRYGSQDMISRAAMRTSGRALWLAMAASLAQRRRGEDEWRVQMLDMAEALGTDNALLYRVQALTYQDADRADEAIAAARRSPELDSEDPMTHYLLAGLLGGSGMDDESARHYEEMARTAGQFRDVAGEAHHHLAWHMQQREDSQQAYLHYEQATPTLSKKWEPALLAALAIRGNEAER
ncbi:MAG TPA: hypothetical protein QGH10_14440, partial [Armatimonadota bacterium]|nr:hypothetical protein [Armatimonadota bacterium]